jgi:hypothetical protein
MTCLNVSMHAELPVPATWSATMHKNPKFATHQEHVRTMRNPPLWPCSTALEHPHVVCTPYSSITKTRLWCTMPTYTYWHHNWRLQIVVCGLGWRSGERKKKRRASREKKSPRHRERWPIGDGDWRRKPLLTFPPQRGSGAARTTTPVCTIGAHHNGGCLRHPIAGRCAGASSSHGRGGLGGRASA